MMSAAQTVPIARAGRGRDGLWHDTSEGLFWRRVDLDDPVLVRGLHLLNSDEKIRAARFRFATDRDRYVAAHVAVRLALAEMTGEPPERIDFRFGRHGKPMLSPDASWVFNISHSGNTGLIVIARRERVSAVGVDVECMRSVDDWQSLARECFSDEECQWLRDAGMAERTRAFLRFWTRKEACVKAVGTGLTVPTRTFTTGFDAGTVMVSIDVAGESNVLVRTLFEEDAAVAALAWCPHSVEASVLCERSPSTAGGGAGMEGGTLSRMTGAAPLQTKAFSWI